MKKAVVLISIIALFIAGGCEKKEKPAIKIGDIEVSAREFNDAFKASRFSKEKTDQRKEFLESYVSRKLILKEAEGLGLHKDPEFLSDVQLFWEQALLKIALERKGNEIVTRVKVSDQEVKDYYEKNKQKNFANKELSAVYDQIKWGILRVKQQMAIQEWVESLKRKTKISVNYKALGINP